VPGAGSRGEGRGSVGDARSPARTRLTDARSVAEARPGGERRGAREPRPLTYAGGVAHWRSAAEARPGGECGGACARPADVRRPLDRSGAADGRAVRDAATVPTATRRHPAAVPTTATDATAAATTSTP